VQLVCAISPALKDGHGYLAIGGHSDMVGRNVEVFDGKIYVPYVFPKPRPDGKPVDAFPREGWLAIDGYAPTKNRLERGGVARRGARVGKRLGRRDAGRRRREHGEGALCEGRIRFGSDGGASVECRGP
jgi:hypothetical protein